MVAVTVDPVAVGVAAALAYTAAAGAGESAAEAASQSASIAVQAGELPTVKHPLENYHTGQPSLICFECQLQFAILAVV